MNADSRPLQSALTDQGRDLENIGEGNKPLDQESIPPGAF
jgi:hypothetical protein